MKLSIPQAAKAALDYAAPTKADKVALGIAAAAAATKLIREHRQAKRERDRITLRFQHGTDPYVYLTRWLADKQSDWQVADVGIASVARGIRMSGEGDPMGVVPRASDTGVNFGGTRISFSTEDGPDKRAFTLATLHTSDKAVASAWLAEMAAASAGQEVPKVRVWSGSYRGWSDREPLESRKLPVLPPGMLESLEADIRWFLGARDWYNSVGVHHHRGYLLHGTPGSGKTTTAVALAATLGMSVCVLPLRGVDDDLLQEAADTTGQNSILLLDDLDHSPLFGGNAAAGEKSVSLRGLLSVLDSPATRAGQVVIATANNIQAFDAALTRPGRFDVVREFGPACAEQVRELALRFGLGAEADTFATAHTGKSMAAVQAVLLERCGLGNR